ncbi:IS21-like element helper ATPase IstB [Vasconcelosia minhoensis]|nr:IS21-like element helper ATPase IstB [Romeria gracilis]
MTPTPTTAKETLSALLKHLKLSHMNHHWQALERQALEQSWSHAQFLLALCEHEASQRYHSRIQPALKEAKLPPAKAISNFDFSRCPNLNQATLAQLSQDPAWLSRGENLLLFGPSGVGKTHLAAAISRALIDLGARVKFCSATALVQQLQAAKADLKLLPALLKLDKYDLLVLDDISYVKKSEAETSVLFELIAHRYELRSLLITANHAFSAWDDIFADTTMTVAAVDRLVHHAVIIEIQADSFRQHRAKQRSQKQTDKTGQVN